MTDKGLSAGAVIDDPVRRRFEVTSGDHLAELTYKVAGGELVLVHTEVPSVFRGQGIAARLVRAALRRAERDDLTIRPLCSYARRWLKEHPGEVGAVRINWQTNRPEA
jgi:uncharacterized protein